MQNRRDQVQAHAFVMSRLVSALLRADPDSPITPVRRFAVGAVCGILLGGLALAGFAVYGIFSPGGSTGWKQPGSLIVEKETGARYVFVDGILRPVVNYTSARLILGRSPVIVSVARKSLAGVPHGLPVGIESAPDYLPDSKQLTANRWQVCSSLRADATGVDHSYVAVRIGSTPAGRVLDEDGGLLVRTPTGQVFLAWRNARLKVPSSATLSALGYAAAPQQLVGWAWINALPAGPDLRAPEIGGRGNSGPEVSGRETMIGQVFKVIGDNSAGQYFVVRPDGLAAITQVGASLLLADPASSRSYPQGRPSAIQLTAAAAALAPQSKESMINPRHPARPPAVATGKPGEVPCLRIELAKGQVPTIEVGFGTPGKPPAATTAGSGTDRIKADEVTVQPGTGLLLRDLPAPGVTTGALFLIADNGVRYPLPSGEVVGILGYAETAALPVPAAIGGLVPVGRPLDPQAAHGTVPFAPPSPAPGEGGGA